MAAFIAAFDLATDTGCCDGEIGKSPRLWTWHLRDGGKSRPERLGHLRALVDDYLREAKPAAIYYEAPLNIRVAIKIGAQEDTLALLRGAIGVLESCAGHAGLPVEGIAVQDARLSLCGQRTFPRDKSGRRTAKDAVMQAARMMGVSVADDHQGDAFAIWWHCSARHNPRLAHLATPLFARQRKPLT